MADVLHPTNEFEQLMADLAAGSEDAAWRITELYTDHILRVVRASLPAAIRSKLDSRDFAQSVWASLLLKRGYLTQVDTPERLIALLATAARNKVIDAYRHYTQTAGYNVRLETPLKREGELMHATRSTKRSDEPFDQNPSPSHYAILREQWARFVDTCSPRDREVINLRMHGDNITVISAKVGIQRRTVSKILDRVIGEFGL